MQPTEPVEVGIEPLAQGLELLTKDLLGMPAQHPRLGIRHRHPVGVEVADLTTLVDLQIHSQAAALGQLRFQGGSIAACGSPAPAGVTIASIQLLAVGKPGAGDPGVAMHATRPHADAGTPRTQREAQATLAEIEAHPGRQANAALKTKGHLDSLSAIAATPKVGQPRTAHQKNTHFPMPSFPQLRSRPSASSSAGVVAGPTSSLARSRISAGSSFFTATPSSRNSLACLTRLARPLTSCPSARS